MLQLSYVVHMYLSIRQSTNLSVDTWYTSGNMEYFFNFGRRLGIVSRQIWQGDIWLGIFSRQISMILDKITAQIFSLTLTWQTHSTIFSSTLSRDISLGIISRQISLTKITAQIFLHLWQEISDWGLSASKFQLILTKLRHNFFFNLAGDIY